MKKEPQVAIEMMSYQRSDERTVAVEEEEEDEDVVNDNNISNRKSEIPFLRRNNCPNRTITRDLVSTL